jgi:hypothetical protein
MDSSHTGVAARSGCQEFTPHERSAIVSKVTIAVDPAKDAFEIAVANPSGTSIERRRPTRPQLEQMAAIGKAA